MQLIKLDATDSTNTYLNRLSRQENLPDFTVVQANHQTAGRGQRGTLWETEGGKNLTFSVLKNFGALPARSHFMLNMTISLSVYTALEALKIPHLSLKWPNDILSGNRKLCGILIENQLQGNFIARSIVGIGLNVNQTLFAKLPGATSLKRVTKRDFDPDEVLLKVMEHLESDLSGMDVDNPRPTLEQYEAHLYLKDQLSAYRRKDGSSFKGTILGVQPDGLLKIALPDGRIESFGFKELQYPALRQD